MTLLDGEFYLLAFGQGFITGALDSREMYEYIFATISGGDKTEAFISVEELYSSSRLIGQDNFLENLNST